MNNQPSNTQQLATTFLLNVGGINPRFNNQKCKLKALNEIINESDTFIPFLVLTETHLKAEVFDAEVAINNYNITRVL